MNILIFICCAFFFKQQNSKLKSIIRQLEKDKVKQFSYSFTTIKPMKNVENEINQLHKELKDELDEIHEIHTIVDDIADIQEDSKNKLIRLTSSAMGPLLTFIALEPSSFLPKQSRRNSTKLVEIDDECDLELQKQLDLLDADETNLEESLREINDV